MKTVEILVTRTLMRQNDAEKTKLDTQMTMIKIMMLHITMIVKKNLFAKTMTKMMIHAILMMETMRDKIMTHITTMATPM